MSDTAQPKSEETVPLEVMITREPFSDYFILTVDGVQVEEMEIDDVLAWFNVRGANMYEIGKVLDYVWNFGRANVVIDKSIKPKQKLHSAAPVL